MGNLNEKLYSASKDGNLDLLKKVFEKDEQKKKMDVNYEKIVNKETKETRTALGIACENGHIAIIQELVKHPDIDINKKVGEIGVPLTIACRGCRLEVVKTLIAVTDTQPPLDVNIQDCRGDTPLISLVKNNDAVKSLEIIQELLKVEKIDVNKPDSKGNTPFFHAIQLGKMEIAKEFMKVKELNVNTGNVPTQISPLYYTCNEGKNMDVMKLLLEDDRIDVNAGDQKGEFNPLFILIENYIKTKEEVFFTMLDELLKHPKLDVNHERKFGEGASIPIVFTFLGRGEETEESTRIFKLLFENERTEILKGDKNNGFNPVLNLCLSKQESKLDLAKLVTGHPKWNVNHQGGEGQYGLDYTCLMAAVANDHMELAFELVEKEGIDLALTTNQGDQPGLNILQISCLRKKYDFVKKLLEEKGVDVNIGTLDSEKDKHDTVCPIFAACAQDDVELLKILTAQESLDLNRREEPPYITPLFIACQRGCCEIVKELTQYPKLDVNKGRVDPPGTREDIKGKYVETPLSAAAAGKKKDVVEVLLTVEGIDPNKGYPKSPWALAGDEEIKEMIGKHSAFKRSDWEF